MFNNLDELMNGLMGKVLPDINDRIKYKSTFVFFMIIWHIVPVFWLLYVLQKDTLIKTFRPNFMGTFLKSALLPIIYYYYENNIKIYGDFNYLMYLVCYIVLLLSVCIILYGTNEY
jgi:hypothetical protein